LPIYDVPGYGKVKGTPETIKEKYGVEVTEKEIGKPPSAPATGGAGYTQVVSKPGAFRAEPTPEPVTEPEPVKEEPEPYMKKETPNVMGDWPKTTGIEPIPSKEGLTKEELTARIVRRENLIREQEKNIEIDPEAKYRVPMIGGRHVSQEELDAYLATKPSGWIPQYQIFTGAEILETREQRGESVTESLRWIARLPSETKIKKTETGYESIPPSPTPPLSVWKVEDWLKDPLGTLGGGVADILQPIHLRLAEDWMIGPTYRKLTGTTATREEMAKASREQWKTRWEEKDYGGMAIGVLSSPLGLIGASYGLGKGMGAFAATKVGQKPLFQVGFLEQKIGSAPEWTYKYTFTITPAKAAQIGVAGYFGYEGIKGGKEALEKGKLPEYLATLAILMPLIYVPYKAGYYSGMGWVQRRAAMAKLTGTDRVQQQALYKGIDIVSRKQYIAEPRYDLPAYDLTRVQKVSPDTASILSQHLRSFRGRYIGKAAIGGSTAMDIQMPSGTFRAGGYPQRLIDIAAQRQLIAFKSGLQTGVAPKPLKLYGKPVDVDILLRGFFAKETASSLSLLKSLDIHVHKSLVGRYYGFGAKTFPSTKALIYDPLSGKPYVAKTLSIREQFIRSSISILSSEQPITGYRSFKDPFTYFDTGKILSYGEGGTELWATMQEFIYPERYPVPKVTLGERFISRIGGAVEPTYVTDAFGIYPTYPKGVYPKELFGKYPLHYATVGISGYIASMAMEYKPSIAVADKAPIISEYKPSVAEGYRPLFTPYETYAVKTEVHLAGGYPVAKKEAPAGISTVPYESPLYDQYTPPYTPPYYPPPVPPYAPPTYQPPYTPPPVPPSYPPPPPPDYTPPYTPPPVPPSYPPPPPPDYTPPYTPPSYPPTPPYYPTYYPPPPPPTKKRLLPGGVEPLEKKPGQAYAVEVKERYIFAGKKEKPEQFKKVKTPPLSQQDALALGGFLVDQSTARSFKIVPVQGKATKLEVDIPPWSNTQVKFYTKDNTYIERTAHAIDTMGEIEGIPHQGILARLGVQKRKEAPVSIRKPRVSGEKAPSKGIYTTDFDFLQPDIDFNKNLREFENLFRRFNHGF
jgi:hypothetical protein